MMTVTECIIFRTDDNVLFIESKGATFTCRDTESVLNFNRKKPNDI